MKIKDKNRQGKKGRKGTWAAERKRQAVEDMKNRAKYNEHINKEYREAAHESFAKAIVGMLWCLHTDYNFGRIRLMRAFLKLQAIFVDYMIMPKEDMTPLSFEGLSFEDISRALYDEVGIGINPYTGSVKMDALSTALYYNTKQEMENHE